MSEFSDFLHFERTNSIFLNFQDVSNTQENLAAWSATNSLFPAGWELN